MASPENTSPASPNSNVLQSVFDLLLSQDKDGIPEATQNTQIIQEEWDSLDPRRRILYARVVAAMFPDDLSGQERASQAALLLRRFETEVLEVERLNAELGLGVVATENSAKIV